MSLVIRIELMRRPRGDRLPRLIAEDPLADPPCPQALDLGLGRDRRLEQRADRDAARILAQLLAKNVAGGSSHQRFAHRRVMPRMLARGDVDEASAGHRAGAAWPPQSETVLARRR